jgi:16S rRNA (guanine527-N7)-methyltransferase
VKFTNNIFSGAKINIMNLSDIDKNNYFEILKNECAVFCIPSGSIEKIFDHLILLINKNAELNLMSRQLKVEEIIKDHICDCLAGAVYFKDAGSVMDLGTGGGLPGILLGILYPEKRIELVEKSPKKCQFLKEAIKSLGLKNVRVNNQTADTVKITTDVITSRAFKDLTTTLELTGSLFDNGVRYILYKGRLDKINEEIAEAKKIFKFDLSIRRIPEIKDKERHIVLIKKL